MGQMLSALKSETRTINCEAGPASQFLRTNSIIVALTVALTTSGQLKIATPQHS